MKRVIVGDSREKVLSTLEVILKHWGYRVVVSSSPEQIEALLLETSPDLLFMGAHLLQSGPTKLTQTVGDKTLGEKCPLVVLKENGRPFPANFPCESLDVPIGLFELYAMIQKYLEKTPRKNLRLDLKLPGVLYRDGAPHLSEILSLSEQGLFIRSAFRLTQNEPLQVIFPLMGMKKELEIEGRVLYNVLPAPENNYLQGSGVEFQHLTDQDHLCLQRFIERCFLGEMTPSERSRMDLTDDQVQDLDQDVSLKLISSH
ncbi:MAG: PilZ domain-containing protein [Desulfuromonadales bacterium]